MLHVANIVEVIPLKCLVALRKLKVSYTLFIIFQRLNRKAIVVAITEIIRRKCGLSEESKSQSC